MSDLAPGIIEGLSHEEYLRLPAVSNSMLSDLARSPYHCWAMHLAPDRPKREPTAAMRAGTLLHMMALEPHRVASHYIVRPDGLDMRTKAGKEWSAQSDGLEVLTAEQYAIAEAQRDALLAVPELAALLANGTPEVSARWIDHERGLDCRMRADWVHPLDDGRVIILDLKTTNDASERGFGRSVWDFGYHRQAAMYTAGYQAATRKEVAAFVFGVVTNDYPYIAVPYMLDDEDMQRGHGEVSELLALYAECQRTDTWPAYGPGIKIIQRPAWVK